MVSEPRFRFLTAPDKEQLLRQIEQEFDHGWLPIGLVAQPDGSFGVLIRDFWEIDSTVDTDVDAGVD